MNHKKFDIAPFERKPGVWRAKITREDGSPIEHDGLKRPEFETSDATTAEEAEQLAIDQIDAKWFT